MILLDTHVVLWARAGSPDVGPECRQLIDRGLREGTLAVSAISFWRIAIMHEEGRIDLSQTVRSWRTRLLADGLTEIPVDGVIAIRASQLNDLQAGPVGRLIIGTALGGHTLVTADERLLSWSGRLRRVDARK